MASRARGLNRAYAVGSIIVGVVLFVGLLVLTGLPAYVDWVIGWSVATFLIYGIDKAQAIRHGWRVPEVWLHIMALTGGFIGGWLGMFVWRHKTQKPIFKVVLVIATLINVALFYFLVLRVG